MHIEKFKPILYILCIITIYRFDLIRSKTLKPEFKALTFDTSKLERVSTLLKNISRLSGNVDEVSARLDKRISFLDDKFEKEIDKINRNQRVLVEGVKTLMKVSSDAVLQNALTVLSNTTYYDCCDLRKLGIVKSGSYSLKLDTQVEAYCDMETDNGGWTLIQRRMLVGAPTNFTKSWKEYEQFFGNAKHSFWIGLRNIAQLTNENQSQQEIRFDMETFGHPGKIYAQYRQFYVYGAENLYKMHIRGYSGTAEDSMSYHNNEFFSTYDQDNDKAEKNCADEHKGGWWYYKCAEANPNGILSQNQTYGPDVVYWEEYSGWYSMKHFEMKIRPLNKSICGIIEE